MQAIADVADEHEPGRRAAASELLAVVEDRHDRAPARDLAVVVAAEVDLLRGPVLVERLADLRHEPRRRVPALGEVAGDDERLAAAPLGLLRDEASASAR
jgi:hypothetical protein